MPVDGLCAKIDAFGQRRRLDKLLEALRMAIERILTGRGYAVDPAIAKRISECADETRLLEWLDRAASAGRVEEVFA